MLSRLLRKGALSIAGQEESTCSTCRGAVIAVWDAEHSSIKIIGAHFSL